MDHQLRQCGIEHSIGKRQVFSRRTLHAYARLPSARGRDKPGWGIDRVYRFGPEALDQLSRQCARATPDVERTLARRHAGKVSEAGRQLTRVATHEAVVGLAASSKGHLLNVRRLLDSAA